MPSTAPNSSYLPAFKLSIATSVIEMAGVLLCVGQDLAGQGMGLGLLAIFVYLPHVLAIAPYALLRSSKSGNAILSVATLKILLPLAVMPAALGLFFLSAS